MIDYKKYPANWRTKIRPAILERANDCCEECGVANYSQGYRDKEGNFYEWSYVWDLLERTGRDLFDDVLAHCSEAKMIKIVLTIAHLDHDVTNNDPSNLKALCQLHHLRHDLQHHKANARKTIDRKKGLQNLFP